MRVVVPYTDLRPGVREALPADAEYVDVSHDEHAYWRLLSRLWADGETFALVEHDIIVNPGTLDAMAACPESWCATSYQVGGAIGVANGCTKYGAALIAAVPDLPERIPDRRWVRLDAYWYEALQPRQPHVHWPAVRHLHHYALTADYNCDRCGQPLPRALIEAEGLLARCPSCG